MADRSANALADSPEQVETHARALLTLASALVNADRIEDASRSMSERFASIGPALAPTSEVSLDAVRIRASIAQRRGDTLAARQMLEAALETPQAPDSAAMRPLRRSLARMLRDSGALESARRLLEALHAESIAARDELQIQADQNDLATIEGRLRHLIDRAESLLRDSLARTERVFARNHPSTLATLSNLLNVRIQLGRLEAADAMSQELLTRLDDGIGRATCLGQSALNARAYLLDDLGRAQEAEALFREVLKLVEEHPSLAGRESLGNRNNLAMLLIERKRDDEAATEFRRGIEAAIAMVGPDHPCVSIFRNNYGECLTKLGRFDEAQSELHASHAGLVATFGPDHERVKQSLARIAAAKARTAQKGNS